MRKKVTVLIIQTRPPSTVKRNRYKLDLILYNVLPQVVTEKDISSNIISNDKNNSSTAKDTKVYINNTSIPATSQQ